MFGAGGYIIKIFAPEESGIGGEREYNTERFGIGRAWRLQIPAPRLAASGVVCDKYIFRYLIMERIEGESLADVSGNLPDAERCRIGKALRDIVDRMDVPCESFNRHALFDKAAESRWRLFSPEFQRERKAYLEAHEKKPQVYVHGDLNPDNIIITADKEIHIIDFADALLAPIELELAGIICDGFKFDACYLEGFIGKYDRQKLAERLVYGLLLHDYGANIIRDNIGSFEEIRSLRELRARISERI